MLGDRCGGMHVVTLEVGKKLVIKQSMPKLHGKMGVTDLRVVGDLLWSSGRDGFLRSYSRVGEEGVTMLQALQVGYDWLAGIRVVGGEMTSLVWHGASMLVRTVGGDTELGARECGGGHRSWDIFEEGGQGELVYIKERQVLMASLWSNEKKVLVPGGHTQQVNVVKQFSIGEDKYLVTGGEETNIRLYSVGKSNCREVAVLRGHLSSVKCFAVQDMGGRKLIISGGGRAEVRVWWVERVEDGVLCSGIGSSLLRGTDREKKKPWRLAQEEVVVDGETRYLSVDTRWEVERHKLLIYLACSDGLIRLFRYCVEGKSFEMVKEIKFHTHCVLHVMLVESMVLTATTGGLLAVWDMELLELRDKTVEPIVETAVHQSGVNCMAVRKSEDRKWLVVTGGDDADLVVTRIVMTHGVAEVNRVWCSGGRVGHAAQLTGLTVLGDWVVTTSVDQRVVVWRVGAEECEWVKSKCGSVADVADLDCWLEGDSLNCAVVGVGMELVTLDLPS